jgi:hypothetical protein
MKFRTSLSSLLLILLVCSSNSQTTNTVGTLTDEEAAEFLLLKPTIRKWLRGEKVWKKFYELSNEDFRFEPAELDLNKDGTKELLIRSGCAAVGNCQFWVFRKTAHGYQMILKTLPGSVQTYRLLSQKAKGYFDLETSDHFDAWSGGTVVYRFNGREYKAVKCSNYSYSRLKNGKLYTLKKPNITVVKCLE